MTTKEHKVLTDLREHLVESLPDERSPEDLAEDWQMGGGGPSQELEFVKHTLVRVIDALDDERHQRKMLEMRTQPRASVMPITEVMPLHDRRAAQGQG